MNARSNAQMGVKMNLTKREWNQYIYGENNNIAERFKNTAGCFLNTYHHDKAEYFTSPGRTEIIGNHTDHNGGKVIAASIDMDTIGAAYPNDTNTVHITSEGYKKEIIINLKQLRKFYGNTGTEGLVAGMLEGVQELGFLVSGFDAYLSSNVISAAGVSSSASFEMLICSIINYFFNKDAMSYTDYAKIGKYAENVYWNKASGMMDQLACAVGGTVLFDFSDKDMPQYTKINFSFHDFGYQLVIVNTGKGHADLSSEYSEIPGEMHQTAKVLGCELLHETTLDTLLVHCNEIANDRAALRAIHFFEETARVENAAALIADRKYMELLGLIQQSGDSSWKLLQNCYAAHNCHEQKVSLMLALTDIFLKTIGSGVCRVHGGGFAGVIMCVIPEKETDNYIQFISQYVGEGNVYPINIRNTGAVHITLKDLQIIAD